MTNQVATTKHCSNCKRDVAEANFVMHEVHCRKNIVLCRKCNEPIPKIQLDEHIEENHALIDCDLCSRAVERSQLDEHKSTLCSKRDRICSYCSLSVKADEYEDHESYCGTRTEKCIKCNSYIMHKDQAMHEESNCYLPERNDQMSKAEMEPYDDDYLLSVKWNDFAINSPSFATEDRGDYFGNTRVDGRYLFDDSRRGSEQQIDINGDEAFLPCEFCDESFPSDVIVQHQAICINQFEDLDYGRTRDYGSNLLDKTKKTSSDKRMLAGSSLAREMTMLPCEFCSELFPNEDLIIHQWTCDIGCLLNNTDNKDQINDYHSQNMRRPPSLPIALNNTGAKSSSMLKSSNSNPVSLSHVTSYSDVDSSAFKSNPESKDVKVRSSNRPLPRKPMSRQLPLDGFNRVLASDRNLGTNRAVANNNQSKLSNGTRPFVERGPHTSEKRVMNNYREHQSSLQLRSEDSSAFSSKVNNTTVRSSSTGNQSLKDSRQVNTGDDKSVALGQVGIQPSFNSSSRSVTARPRTINQGENQYNLPRSLRHERETGARRNHPRASSNQTKNSRSSQD